MHQDTSTLYMKSFPIILKGWRERRNIGKESKTARRIGQLLEMNRKEKGDTGSFQGDLQASGERLRWKSMSWPHLGHSMWSCQDVGWIVADCSVCSMGGCGIGNKLSCKAANRERRVAAKKPK